jgi:hypothetical protein
MNTQSVIPICKPIKPANAFMSYYVLLEMSMHKNLHKRVQACV